MKQKILIYLCMNAIFSKTMQDTETQISQFIVEGTANTNMGSNCQNTIWFIFKAAESLKCYKVFKEIFKAAKMYLN